MTGVLTEAEDTLRALLQFERPDPYPGYKRLRELAPVYRSEAFGLTVLTRYADCQRVLADAERFPVVDRAWMRASDPDWEQTAYEEIAFGSLLFTNPPEHTRLRRFLCRDFTGRLLESLWPAVERETTLAFDRLFQALADGDADYQEMVAGPLSVAVIGDLFGVPPGDRAWLRQLVETIIPALTPQPHPGAAAAARARSDHAAGELCGYFTDLVARRRRAPASDLLSAYTLVAGEAPGGMSDVDLARAVLPVFGTGFTTVSDALGCGLHALLNHPEQYALLAERPELAPQAAAELLRYASPYHLARRVAAVDAEVAGQEIPAGSVLLLVLAAANRDPAVFADPERLRVDRAQRVAVPFGQGIHHCVGAGSAKMQIHSVCAALSRFPRLRAAEGASWRPSLFFFGPQSLPVAAED